MCFLATANFVGSEVLGADAYTALAETRDQGPGYPVLDYVKRLVKDQIIWALPLPALSYRPPVAVISTSTSARASPSGTSQPQRCRGPSVPAGEFTFLLLTAEAAVALVPPAKAKKV
jgi:hypothetical protein